MSKALFCNSERSVIEIITALCCDSSSVPVGPSSTEVEIDRLRCPGKPQRVDG